MMTTEQLTNRVKGLETELALVKKLLADAKEEESGGFWLRSKTSTRVPIRTMDDCHLLNCLRVCMRIDPMYEYNAERFKSFTYLIREANRRGIDHSDWAKAHWEYPWPPV